MKSIGELFARDPKRRIEEVIKVDQAVEEVVRGELEEYVVTEAIREHYRQIYKAMADALAEPHEGIGVWVSGFFGSGKSSFAKILGYTVANRKVQDTTASKLFKEIAEDRKISELLDFLNTRIPTHAVIFDVSMDRRVRVGDERITGVMYKALLRELGYAEDFDLAELEITLEADNRLDAFVQRFEELHNAPWRVRRKLGLAINEASAALHKLDPSVYPEADSWAKSVGTGGRADITANDLARRAFELVARRKPGHALIFVIDEVGQYVSRSVDKMLDLAAVVQAFGREGRNRVKAKQAVAPCWIIVTSQEKLDEVVDSLESRKIELARLQDRFPTTIDLKQSDIAEVTSRRVLDKRPEAKETLEELYDQNEGRLRTFSALERTSRNTNVSKEDFVRLYPYLPYQIDLCIDIVAGLRLKRGAQRHIGGSNRTIIKQAQQMLVHPRTNLSKAPIGTLVTLDKVYELLYEGNLLPSEVTREVDNIPSHDNLDEMAYRVAKAIALLETVRNLPRTPRNLAVVLHPSVAADSLQEEVTAALKALEKEQFVRESEEGYKLLTVQERSWDTTRRAIAPRPADRNRIKREMFAEIFSDPSLSIYQHPCRAFKVALKVDDQGGGQDGHIVLNLLTADDDEEFEERCTEARTASNDRQNELFWVARLTENAHGLVEELHRSREMIATHERLAGQGKRTDEESSCLPEEKIRRDRIQRDLRSALAESLQGGSGFFRGVQRDASALGRALPEVMQAFLREAVPALFPKLELGGRHLKGNEAEQFLTAANLSGLPPIFYEGDEGLGLVMQQAGKFVPNPGAEICKEVLDFLRREHSYGNKVTGKIVETHFHGIGYGWNVDILKLVMAVLLRGGAVELTHQGRKYRNHNDPACRVPLTRTPAFRSASFAPREALDLKMLTEAARRYEEITGREVDIEEGAIAAAFQQLAAQDRERIVPVLERMRALNLPGVEAVAEHLQTVEGILEMAADDCVTTLAGEGKSYQEARARISKLAEGTSGKSLEVIRRARRVLQSHWPALEGRGVNDNLGARARVLAEKLQSEDFFDAIEAMKQAAEAIAEEHARLYEKAHKEREDVFSEVIDRLKGQPEWAAFAGDPDVSEERRNAVLAPLAKRGCGNLQLGPDSPVCAACRSSLNEIEADIAAAAGLAGAVREALAREVSPNQRVEKVRLAEFLGGRIESPEDVEAAVSRLREHLLKLLAAGVKIVLE